MSYDMRSNESYDQKQGDVMTLHEIMYDQLDTAHPIQAAKKLANYRRAQLDMYMIDCHGFDAEQLAEWESKADLAADIKSFGWEAECLEYLA